MRILEDNDSICLWEEEEITCYVFKKPVLDLELVKLAIATRSRLTNNSPCLLIIDMSNVKSTTKEARSYYAASNTEDLVKAVALITPSLVTKMMATFFINFDKPPIPVKMFSTKPKAIAWLKSLEL